MHATSAGSETTMSISCRLSMCERAVHPYPGRRLRDHQTPDSIGPCVANEFSLATHGPMESGVWWSRSRRPGYGCTALSHIERRHEIDIVVSDPAEVACIAP